jgi:hypothetical protein
MIINNYKWEILLMNYKVVTSDGTAELVKELKKQDFPTFGIPTIPIFKLLDGRPKSGF